MTTTTRSAECHAPGTTLMLAFDLGSTKWTLEFTTSPAQRPRIRPMPAGDLGTLVKEIQLAKARFGLPLGAPVRSVTRRAGTASGSTGGCSATEAGSWG